MKAPLKRLAAALLTLGLAACDAPDDSAPEAETESPVEAGIAVTDWQQQQREQFEQAAAHWQQALVGFEQQPGDAALTSLRGALGDWYGTFTAQAMLLNTRACQLDQQPILARMDSWPLYPGYIDAMPQWPESGLISDPYLEMDRKTLRIQHGATDAAEASLGFAAMFVVLNGTGETAKPLDRFQGEANGAPRRLSYLKLAGEQILADYQALLASDIPVTASNLECGLERMQERHQQLANSADNDDEQVIPQTVRKTVADKLLASLQSLPEDTGTAWNDSQPGILDAIAASEKNGWQAIEAWQAGHSE